MQKFAPKVGLERFREDAVHCQAMCEAIAAEPDEPKAAEYAALATRTKARIDAIDARIADVRRGNDVVIRGKALEKVRKLRSKHAYEQARRELAAEAATIYRTLLPIAPSVVGKSGIKRAVALVEQALAQLRTPDMPESIRTDHVPVIEGHLVRMREADLVEDDAAAALIALRAGIVLFKANQQRERESAYGQLVGIVGKAEADEYFLSSERGRSENVEDDDHDDSGDPVAG